MERFPLTIGELSFIENASIKAFVQQAATDGLLSGRVLDYGAGMQPYRQVVKAAGGGYVPWNRKDLPGCHGAGDIGSTDVLEDGGFDTVLLTQVVEYVPDVYRLLRELRDAVKPGGALVLTYPTVWPELPGDLHRFTKEGMGRLLAASAWSVVRHEVRAALEFDGFTLPLGYGAVCRA